MAWVACTDDTEKETNDKIDENCQVLEDYRKKLTEIRTAEISTFQEMDEIINPPDVPTEGSSTGSTYSNGSLSLKTTVQYEAYIIAERSHPEWNNKI